MNSLQVWREPAYEQGKTVNSLIFLCDGPLDTAAAVDALSSNPNVRRAVLNTVLSSRPLTPMDAGDIAAYALLQIWVEALEDPLRRTSGALGLPRGYEVSRRVFIPPPEEPVSLKRMSLLERASSLPPEKFREVWFSTHGPRVAAQAGALLGYCQNHVVRCCLSAPHCDGMTELWFADEASMFEALPPSPVRSDAPTAHAGTFIDRITTFLVKEERLK